MMCTSAPRTPVTIDICSLMGGPLHTLPAIQPEFPENPQYRFPLKTSRSPIEAHPSPPPAVDYRFALHNPILLGALSKKLFSVVNWPVRPALVPLGASGRIQAP